MKDMRREKRKGFLAPHPRRQQRRQGKWEAGSKGFSSSSVQVAPRGTSLRRGPPARMSRFRVKPSWRKGCVTQEAP